MSGPDGAPRIYRSSFQSSFLSFPNSVWERLTGKLCFAGAPPTQATAAQRGGETEFKKHPSLSPRMAVHCYLRQVADLNLSSVKRSSRLCSPWKGGGW